MLLIGRTGQNRTFKNRRKLVLLLLVKFLFFTSEAAPINDTKETTTESSHMITTTFENLLEDLDLDEDNAGLPEAVEQLTVNPIPIEGRHGELQLNVSWIRPEGKIPPKDYSVEIIPDGSNGCISKLCYEFNIHSNASWALVPKSHSVVEGIECSIKPGCSYTIRLIAHPPNAKEISVIDIKLPECVGNVCSCTKRSKLPKPSLNVEHGDSTVNISWFLPVPVPEDVNVSHYMLSFAEQKIESVFHKPWFVHDQIFHIPWSDDTPTWKQLKAKTFPGKKYLARLQLVDQNGCLGPTGNYTLTYDTPQDDTAYKTQFPLSITWVIVLTIVPMGIIIFMIMVIFCRPSRCRLKSLIGSRIFAITRSEAGVLRRQTAWLPYREDESQRTSSTTTTMNRCSEERSPLYVEKEIEEARSRGEADQWEIHPNRLLIGKQLGEGAFGRVHLAKTDIPGYPTVAVKLLKNNASIEEASEFLGEIRMLKVVGYHPNVVALVGCCTLKQPYCALLQYAPKGDLLNHLRNLRKVWNMKRFARRVQKPSVSSSYVQAPLPDRPSFAETEYTMLESDLELSIKLDTLSSINTLASDAIDSLPMDPISLRSVDTGMSVSLVLEAATLHGYALQIAKGMEHLEKKGITHRDLAARNVLIDAQGNLKVSDLGLSRAGEYVHTKHRKVPLRWLALEAIKESRYSNKSDVWAYAILLWEIGTLGAFPYSNLNDQQILGFLCEGKRLDRPEIVSHELYSTMIMCWKEDPAHRPTFGELVMLLDMDEAKNKAYVDLDTLRSNYVFPPTEEFNHSFRIPSKTISEDHTL